MDNLIRLAVDHCPAEYRRELQQLAERVVDKAKRDNPNGAGWRLIDKVEEDLQALLDGLPPAQGRHYAICFRDGLQDGDEDGILAVTSTAANDERDHQTLLALAQAKYPTFDELTLTPITQGALMQHLDEGHCEAVKL